jgi:hypothetical protein
MYPFWREIIRKNVANVNNNIGPNLVTVVTGNESDMQFWKSAITKKRYDVFRKDGKTDIVVVNEKKKKGNFLGTVNAWKHTKNHISLTDMHMPNVALMTMVFGLGTRFSPFTQAMGGRKPAFPLPRRGPISKAYLNTADISNLFSNRWMEYLENSGFKGMVVKWGDESIIPGISWDDNSKEFADVDAVRFVWKTEITEDLAREKDWLVIDANTNLMRFQFPRQNINSLRKRLTNLASGSFDVAVNLGSLAVSYDCLDIAMEVFKDELEDDKKWFDWDPYVWMALSCKNQDEWDRERNHELSIGKEGIRDLEKRVPNFYPVIKRFREAVENHKKRQFRVGTLDFGDAFWTDIGLHITLRECFLSMTVDTIKGQATRDLFGIPHERDERGNTIINSQVPSNAEIRGSIIIDTIIEDPKSIVDQGVIIGGKHKLLEMPYGGVAFQSAVNRLTFDGPNGVAFRLIGEQVNLPEGGRLTTLLIKQQYLTLESNESILDYTGMNYTKPILNNSISFSEATEIMSKIDNTNLDEQWQQIIDNW